MRTLLLAGLAAIACLGTASTSSASDGCWVNPRSGRWECMPGARPGVPYYGAYNRGRRYERSASDGCWVNPRSGRWECMPGARPGVPYYGAYDRGRRYERRFYYRYEE
jgi:hypothetical protein